MEYYVAKSYQEWKKESEPFEVNGKMYVTVRRPNGSTSNVRAYTEKEYNRMYGPCASAVAEATAAAVSVPTPKHKVKNILGFQEGYIWIFKGDLEEAEYWFAKTPECRYHVAFGWYIVSTDNIPFDIPCCIESIKLPWEKVGNDDETLLPTSIVEAAVSELRYGGHPSQYQGNVGDHLALTLYLKQIKTLPPTQYGLQTIYTFEDASANVFTWKTGVNKSWSVGDEIHCKAGVKSHDTVRGIRQTTLTRLTEEKKK